MRVITDNDYSGDPDGLFQLAHLLLSPSVDVRAVIGSHVRPGDVFDPSDRSATNAADQADVVIDILGLSGRHGAIAGSEHAMVDRETPMASTGATVIIDEAMSDSDLPLFVTVGGGLTEVASAYLIEPRIASRLTVIWIGGPEYPGIAVAPPQPDGPDLSEYNTRIDIPAAQVIFDSPIPMWQVPRDSYRQAVMSEAELTVRIARSRIGTHLLRALDQVKTRESVSGRNLGETYVLGDNPLVLLTALQSPFEPDPSSSRYDLVPAPSFDDDGGYVPGRGGRGLRVYTRLDTRLMFEDMTAKFSGTS